MTFELSNIKKLVCSSIGIYIGYSATGPDGRELRQTGDYRNGEALPVAVLEALLPISELMAEFLMVSNTVESVHRVGLTFETLRKETGSGIQTSLFRTTYRLGKERSCKILSARKEGLERTLYKAMDLLPRQWLARQRNAQIGGHRSGEKPMRLNRVSRQRRWVQKESVCIADAPVYLTRNQTETGKNILCPLMQQRA